MKYFCIISANITSQASSLFVIFEKTGKLIFSVIYRNFITSRLKVSSRHMRITATKDCLQ